MGRIVECRERARACGDILGKPGLKAKVKPLCSFLGLIPWLCIFGCACFLWLGLAPMSKRASEDEPPTPGMTPGRSPGLAHIWTCTAHNIAALQATLDRTIGQPSAPSQAVEPPRVFQQVANEEEEAVSEEEDLEVSYEQNLADGMPAQFNRGWCNEPAFQAGAALHAILRIEPAFQAGAATIRQVPYYVNDELWRERCAEFIMSYVADCHPTRYVDMDIATAISVAMQAEMVGGGGGGGGGGEVGGGSPAVGGASQEASAAQAARYQFAVAQGYVKLASEAASAALAYAEAHRGGAAEVHPPFERKRAFSPASPAEAQDVQVRRFPQPKYSAPQAPVQQTASVADAVQPTKVISISGPVAEHIFAIDATRASQAQQNADNRATQAHHAEDSAPQTKGAQPDAYGLCMLCKGSTTKCGQPWAVIGKVGELINSDGHRVNSAGRLVDSAGHAICTCENVGKGSSSTQQNAHDPAFCRPERPCPAEPYGSWASTVAVPVHGLRQGERFVDYSRPQAEEQHEDGPSHTPPSPPPGPQTPWADEPMPLPSWLNATDLQTSFVEAVRAGAQASADAHDAMEQQHETSDESGNDASLRTVLMIAQSRASLAEEHPDGDPAYCPACNPADGQTPQQL